MTMTQTELQDRIIERAVSDGEFRARLMADPRDAIQELTGEVIPDGVSVQVHEESATSFHLVLPPAGQLSESEMTQVFGGNGASVTTEQAPGLPEAEPNTTITAG